jgi:hypothetical protein
MTPAITFFSGCFAPAAFAIIGGILNILYYLPRKIFSDLSITMNQEIVDAVHKAITPAEMKDMYYPGMENTEAVAFASYVENRFQASLPSATFGSSSTVIFNPTEGLGDILLTLKLPSAAEKGSAYTGLGCSEGWGYA